MTKTKVDDWSPKEGTEVGCGGEGKEVQRLQDEALTHLGVSMKFHRETKGRFRKRVVLANVPSFPVSRSGGTCECTLVPVFVPGEHPNVPSFRFLSRGNIRQNPPFGKPPFCQPSKIASLSGVIRTNRFAHPIRANRKFEFFGRIGLTR